MRIFQDIWLACFFLVPKQSVSRFLIMSNKWNVSPRLDFDTVEISNSLQYPKTNICLDGNRLRMYMQINDVYRCGINRPLSSSFIAFEFNFGMILDHARMARKCNFCVRFDRGRCDQTLRIFFVGATFCSQSVAFSNGAIECRTETSILYWKFWPSVKNRITR